MSTIIRSILRQIEGYLQAFPEEGDRLQPLLVQMEQDPTDILSRTSMLGHITASSFILNPMRNSALLIKHKALGLWLQPGGHFEGDLSLQDAAKREAEEEAGIAKLRPLPIQGNIDIPLDIDTHPIPARPEKGEASHCHHDFTFLFQALNDEIPKIDVDEVSEAEWVDLDKILLFKNARMQILARKTISMFKD